MSALNRAPRPAGGHYAAPSRPRGLTGAGLALVWTLAWTLTGLPLAQAQSPAPALQVEPVIEDPDLLTSPEADPPSRVARLGYLAGDVDIAPAGSDDWAEAVLNRPLTTGDRLWLPPAARAELQIASTVVYLDGDTRFGFITLDDDLLHASLMQGTATVRVRRLAAGETLQVETPQATIVLREVGEYHLEAAADGAYTVVKTRSGLAEAHGTGEVHRIASGQLAQLTGLEPLQARMSMLNERTAFEDWANQRDARAVHSQSAQYVAEDVIGYEDLDEHGQWHQEPEYGAVWQPRHVAADWAPYRDGRWGWVAPWGWTWIDSSRWGFAPFHYGRWVQVRQRWCWVPGPRHHRAVYSPALVGWVGSAPVNVTVNIGNIGWYPLGPRDAFRPGYRHSRHYIQRINISNTVFITQRHFHGGVPAWPRFDARRHHHGFTAVRHDLFVGAHHLRGHHLRLDHQGLRQWHAHSRPPAIAPYRESVLIGRQRHGPAREFRQRDFVAGRIPFHRERHAMEGNGGRPLDRLQLRGGASRDRSDFITQRRQLQREFGIRNADYSRSFNERRDMPRSTGNRVIREDRQGFNPPTRRFDDGARDRAIRDATGERLQIIRAEENGRAPRSNDNTLDDRQRWRSPPSREPVRDQWRSNRPEPGGSRFITQPGQRDGRTNPPGRVERGDNRPGQPGRVERREDRSGRPGRIEQREGRAGQPGRIERRDNRAGQPGRMEQRDSRSGQPGRVERRDSGSSRFVTQPRSREAQPSRPSRSEQRAQPRSPERSQPRGSPPQRSDRNSGSKRQAAPWNSGKP